MKRLIETLKYWLEAGIISILLIFVALLALAFLRPALASSTDYRNHYLTQQISLEELSRIEREADEAWIAEHGATPPNLMAESEKYLEKMTALLQAEKNKERTNEQP